MKTAPVSVVIPCYCSADVLPRAIESVLKQTLLPQEIILVNDASPDGGQTRKCIEVVTLNIHSKEVIKVHAIELKKNVGAGEARNIAIGLSSQPFIAFLDSDDAWTSEKIEVQYAFMKKNPSYVLSCHKAQYANAGLKFIIHNSMGYCQIRKLNLFLGNVIQTSSVMIKNDVSYRFPKMMRYAEDYWLWLHIIMRGGKMVLIDKEMSCTFKKVYGESGLSGNLIEMHKGVLRCFKDLRSAGLIGHGIYFFSSCCEILKHCYRLFSSKFY